MSRCIPLVILIALALQACATSGPSAPPPPPAPIKPPRVDPPFVQGMQYGSARTLLFDNSWRGVAQPQETISERCGARGECKIYPEIEACSGTGTAQCTMLFNDGYGRDVRLVTTGQSPMTLESWTYADAPETRG